MLHALKFGTAVASRASLITVVRQSGKVLTGITENQLSGYNVDRMDYKIAKRVASESFIELLKAPGEAGTKSYLVFMHHLEVAYISAETSPRMRIYSAWYSAFFVRAWKAFLGDNPGAKQKRDGFSCDSSEELHFKQP